jgi:hypothetical protein
VVRPTKVAATSAAAAAQRTVMSHDNPTRSDDGARVESVTW